MEAVLCFTTEFGGRGQDLFREVMHMRGSKAKCDGKEHSVLGKKKERKKTWLKLLGQHNFKAKIYLIMEWGQLQKRQRNIPA